MQISHHTGKIQSYLLTYT